MKERAECSAYSVSYVRFAFLQISQEKLYCADIELSLFNFLFLTIKKFFFLFLTTK